MAVTFSLTCATVTTLDLTDTSDSIFLQEFEYVPVVATPTGDGTVAPYVTETIPVGLHAVSYDTYATVMQTLALHQKTAAEYWVNPQQHDPVWLNCKADGEGDARRALVKAIHFEFRPWPQGLNPLYGECSGGVAPNMLLGTLLIERHPYWERDAARIFPNATPAAAASVAYDYTATADVVGDVPARINGLAVRTATGGVFIGRFWMGIRSLVLHGATGVTNFIPVWECENGSNQDAEVADVVDASASGGDNVTVTPAGGGTDWDDGAFHLVFTITVAQAGYATESDAFGRFLWLLRAKVSAAATTWQVRLRFGYSTAQSYTDPIEVTNQNWDYHELGHISIPPRNVQALDNDVLHFTIEDTADLWLYAQRTAGAGNLLLDCLCPIPIDEGFLKCPDANTSTGIDCVIGQGPHDKEQLITASNSGVWVPPFEMENFRLPPGDGRIICVYAEDGSSTITHQIEFADVTFAHSLYTERWTALRGNE